MIFYAFYQPPAWLENLSQFEWFNVKSLKIGRKPITITFVLY